jgi:Ser/Thr protein kinase RdoA (MazF antagonist)
MATVDDIRAIAVGLPGSEERTTTAGVSWFVRSKPFVWECHPWPSVPEPVRTVLATEQVFGVKIGDPIDGGALREMDPRVFLPQTTRWGEPKIAFRLAEIAADHLQELVVEAWRVQAPKYLVREFDDAGEQLAGGNASGAVVRIGSTVRKQWTEATPSVHAYLRSLRAAGIDVPAPQGRDELGRQIVEFVPGALALDAARLTLDDLRRVGAMVRSIHDASETFIAAPDAVWQSAIPAPAAELVCHNDLAPWNLVMGERWVFIDWDAAAPSTRLWDLAYAAVGFALSRVDLAPEEAAADLAALIDGYGADDALRAALPEAIGVRAEAMSALLTTAHAEHREPWATMFAEGHGDHWSAVVAYARAHRELWRAALDGRS